jgi:hypothetical protein
MMEGAERAHLALMADLEVNVPFLEWILMKVRVLPSAIVGIVLRGIAEVPPAVGDVAASAEVVEGAVVDRVVLLTEKNLIWIWITICFVMKRLDAQPSTMTWMHT